MAKIISLTMITLLLFLTLARVLARPEPTFRDITLAETHGTDHNEVQKAVRMAQNSCGGVEEDECMMRRTLEAHLDYIYVQNHNQP